MHPTRVRITSSCYALCVRGARNEVRLACARVSALHRDRRQFRCSIGSDGFGKGLIGTRGARETFLDGAKGRLTVRGTLVSFAPLPLAVLRRSSLTVRGSFTGMPCKSPDTGETKRPLRREKSSKSSISNSLSRRHVMTPTSPTRPRRCSSIFCCATRGCRCGGAAAYDVSAGPTASPSTCAAPSTRPVRSRGSRMRPCSASTARPGKMAGRAGKRARRHPRLELRWNERHERPLLFND